MKKLILAVLLVSSAAFAGESSGSTGSAAVGGGGTVGSDGSGPRPFRILSHSADDRYAMAWGLDHQLVDFEKLEKDPKQVDQFVNANSSQFQNYLVDLVTNRVLYKIIPSELTVIGFELGDRAANHYTVQAQVLRVNPPQNLNEAEARVVAVIDHYRWTDQISHLLVIDEWAVGGPQVTKEISGLQEKIQKELRKKLSSEQQQYFDNEDVAPFLTLSDANPPMMEGTNLWAQHLHMDLQKAKYADDQVLSIDADLQFDYDGKDISVKVLSMKANLGKI